MIYCFSSFRLNENSLFVGGKCSRNLTKVSVKWINAVKFEIEIHIDQTKHDSVGCYVSNKFRCRLFQHPKVVIRSSTFWNLIVIEYHIVTKNVHDHIISKLNPFSAKYAKPLHCNHFFPKIAEQKNIQKCCWTTDLPISI